MDIGTAVAIMERKRQKDLPEQLNQTLCQLLEHALWFADLGGRATWVGFRSWRAEALIQVINDKVFRSFLPLDVHKDGAYVWVKFQIC